MKIHAIQHIPAYVETDEQNAITVASLAELLAVPWIARWAESWPDHEVAQRSISWPKGIRTESIETRRVKAQTFHRWSLADRGTQRQTLMAEFDHGDKWWVVAFLTSDEPIDLPEWQMTDAGREKVARWNRGETS